MIKEDGVQCKTYKIYFIDISSILKLNNYVMTNDFTKIEPGGSLLIAWQLKDKKVVLIGGGEVAAGRIVNLLNADASKRYKSKTIDFD